MNWWKSSKTFPLRIFLLALILRLVPVLVMRTMGIGLDDMFQYDMLARSMAAGNGYRWYAQADLPAIQAFIPLELNNIEYDPRGVLSSFRPPLYPAFLALIYLIFGVGAQRFFAARLVQTALAASLAPLTYALARRLFPDRARPAVIAAWVIALYPMLVIYPLSLATENLFFVLALCSLLALLKAKESLQAQANPPRPRSFFFKSRWFILSGILLGMLALTRSVSLVFAGLAVVWVWFIIREWKMALIVFAAISLVTLPWMVRNSLLNHRLSGIEVSLGYQLYVGYYPTGTGTFQYPQSVDLLSIVDDAQRDAVGMEKALDFIKADPARFPYLALRRTGYFFGLERRALTYFYSNNFFGYIPQPLLIAIAAIVCLPFVFVSVSGTLGMALARWRKEMWLVGLFFIGYVTPNLFIIAEDRFHLAMVPLLAILAAVCWTGGWAAFKERWQTRTGKIAILLACLAVILLFTNWGLELWRDSAKLAQLFGPLGNQSYFSY